VEQPQKTDKEIIAQLQKQIEELCLEKDEKACKEKYEKLLKAEQMRLEKKKDREEKEGKEKKDEKLSNPNPTVSPFNREKNNLLAEIRAYGGWMNEFLVHVSSVQFSSYDIVGSLPSKSFTENGLNAKWKSVVKAQQKYKEKEAQLAQLMAELYSLGRKRLKEAYCFQAYKDAASQRDALEKDQRNAMRQLKIETARKRAQMKQKLTDWEDEHLEQQSIAATKTGSIEDINLENWEESDEAYTKERERDGPNLPDFVDNE